MNFQIESFVLPNLLRYHDKKQTGADYDHYKLKVVMNLHDIEHFNDSIGRGWDQSSIQTRCSQQNHEVLWCHHFRHAAREVSLALLIAIGLSNSTYWTGHARFCKSFQAHMTMTPTKLSATPPSSISLSWWLSTNQLKSVGMRMAVLHMATAIPMMPWLKTFKRYIGVWGCLKNRNWEIYAIL